MKQLTTTKAVYRGVAISVSSDRFEGKMKFCCGNELFGPVSDAKWFDTQGEALANERNDIDRKLGFTPQSEMEPSVGRGRGLRRR